MARETILTYDGLVTAGLLVKNRGNIWVVLGRQTPWLDEDIPDAPTQGTSSIEEPLVAIRASIQSMVREVSSTDYNLLSPSNRAIAYSESGYVYLELVDDSLAYDSLARMVYVEATYAPLLGMPSGDFRIYGACSGLEPAAGYENADWLEPGNIDDFGLLIQLSHGKVYSHTESGGVVQIPMLIEFNV